MGTHTHVFFFVESPFSHVCVAGDFCFVVAGDADLRVHRGRHPCDEDRAPTIVAVELYIIVDSVAILYT